MSSVLDGGPRARRPWNLKKKFAEYVGAKHAIALNSCTAALHLARGS